MVQILNLRLRILLRKLNKLQTKLIEQIPELGCASQQEVCKSFVAIFTRLISCQKLFLKMKRCEIDLKLFKALLLLFLKMFLVSSQSIWVPPIFNAFLKRKSRNGSPKEKFWPSHVESLSSVSAKQQAQAEDKTWDKKPFQQEKADYLIIQRRPKFSRKFQFQMCAIFRIGEKIEINWQDFSTF